MNISEYINQYKNHPVLFIGTGLSLRYLENSFTWDGLLKKISTELKGNSELYLDIKADCQSSSGYDYTKIAKQVEFEFNKELKVDRNGKFKEINDQFYDSMNNGVNLSRFKIYISELLSDPKLVSDKTDEINEFKKVRKNIGSIITTNYDSFIEDLFGFEPLIGNDILLSNPYGSVYKIHGCVTQADKVIITEDDYILFDKKYELIRAQLLSIFIHNPIIFLGYNIGDDNIKYLLKTIFTYVEPNSEDAKRIKENFLLVEFEENSDSLEITDHDIDLEGFSTIRINKIKTDNFIEIYKSLSNLTLPISAMDVRKVQNIVKDIYSGGDIKVNITEDLDSLKNSDKIIAIGSTKTITYVFQTQKEIISNYFKLIDESNIQSLKLIDKHTIQSSQWFPIFGFSTVYPELNKSVVLKIQQKSKLEHKIEGIHSTCKKNHSSIKSINEDDSITNSKKIMAILYNIYSRNIDLDDTEEYLRHREDRISSDFKMLICCYDFLKYS